MRHRREMMKRGELHSQSDSGSEEQGGGGQRIRWTEWRRTGRQRQRSEERQQKVKCEREKKEGMIQGTQDSSQMVGLIIFPGLRGGHAKRSAVG